MIDMHYDLLSVVYQCYLRSDYSYLDKWLANYREDNVSGVFSNLYFMNEEEMKQELGEEYGEINVLEMFKTSTEILQKYFPGKNLIFSIEGCDYIKDEKELEELYKAGLRSMLLVWNNPNKYGSGNNGDYGLTSAGKKLLKKAIDLGIIIDMSHMNKQTFYDTICFLRKQKSLGKKVKVIASHSNSYEVYPHVRNLDDEQLRTLKEFDAVIGVVSYSRFVDGCEKNVLNLKDKYLEHIKHIASIVGVDHVGVSTDDMTFAVSMFGDEEETLIFDYKNVKDELQKLVSKEFNSEEVEMILEKNILRKIEEE